MQNSIKMYDVIFGFIDIRIYNDFDFQDDFLLFLYDDEFIDCLVENKVYEICI